MSCSMNLPVNTGRRLSQLSSGKGRSLVNLHALGQTGQVQAGTYGRLWSSRRKAEAPTVTLDLFYWNLNLFVVNLCSFSPNVSLIMLCLYASLKSRSELRKFYQCKREEGTVQPETQISCCFNTDVMNYHYYYKCNSITTWFQCLLWPGRQHTALLMETCVVGQTSGMGDGTVQWKAGVGQSSMLD